MEDLFQGPSVLWRGVPVDVVMGRVDGVDHGSRSVIVRLWGVGCMVLRLRVVNYWYRVTCSHI